MLKDVAPNLIPLMVLVKSLDLLLWDYLEHSKV